MTDKERREELEPLFPPSESPPQGDQPIMRQLPKKGYKLFQAAKKCPYHGWPHENGVACEPPKVIESQKEFFQP